MASNISLPTNAVYFGGAQVKRITKLVKTAAGLRKKRLVVYDTDDDHCKLGGADAIHGLWGWLEDIVKANGQEWHNDADPAAEDHALIVRGKGIHVCGVLVTGENVKAGDLLVAAADGKVKKASTLAIATGSTAVTSTAANGGIITGSAPPGGRIVGEALHDVDATSEDKDIGIDSWI